MKVQSIQGNPNSVHLCKLKLIPPFRNLKPQTSTTGTPLVLKQYPFVNQSQVSLSNGWYKANPLLGAYYKVFDLGKEKDALFLLAWVREQAALIHARPVPKCSLFYKYLTNMDPEKQKHLVKLELLILNAFIEAKNFLDVDKDISIGMEVSGGTDYIMSVRGPFGGIEIAYPYIDYTLEAITNGKTSVVKIMQKFFKGAFAHEITHQIRNEIKEEKNSGQEIASHVINLLAGGGEDLLNASYFNEFLEKTENDYDMDTVCGMKVLYKKLLHCKNVTYKPKDFTSDQLNKSMLSIPEDIREKTLKQIAKEILYAKPIELLRIAAGIELTKKGQVISFLPELEKAS